MSVDSQTQITAKVFEKPIKTKGLSELKDILDHMDEESFDDVIILEIIRLDPFETVNKLFKFKQINTATEMMFRNTLRDYDYRNFEYSMMQFDGSLLTQQLVIDEKPQRLGIWRVILDFEDSFVDQEVFDSLFNAQPGTKAIPLALHTCGTSMISNSHLEIVAGVPSYSMEVFATILQKRGHLDGLITEEVIIKALRNDNLELLENLLRNLNNPSALLTKRAEEAAEQETATIVLWLHFRAVVEVQRSQE